ncbi:hypothetical protein QR680_003976 [Steinernema hermaphroditum]|uniref:Apple domain-containing protein n=1 Tax=Steinernema hermaphroditum TaxID=289476 RepID=A0AA39LT07_9BILA|nr:hypothetical protein QR680_003976 [Steinernema hermaphroditum]
MEYHYRYSTDKELSVGKNQLTHEVRETTDDCIKWCAQESQCTSGVYLFDHKACHLLNNIPKIDESGQRNQMSFVKVTTEEDKKCEKSFTEVVNGLNSQPGKTE